MKTKQLAEDPRTQGIVCCICTKPIVPMIRILDKRIVKQYPGHAVKCNDPECQKYMWVETACEACGDDIKYIASTGSIRRFCESCQKKKKSEYNKHYLKNGHLIKSTLFRRKNILKE